MRKLLVLFLTICLLATTFCIPISAAEEPSPNTVLRITANKSNGTNVFVADYDNFEDGWNAAMGLATNSKKMSQNDYVRVVVDLYADWTATNGIFGAEDNDGFYWSSIYFPDDVCVTLNMNGHTINRDLKSPIADGEVMYIDADTDIVINNGTITGGFSINGAGGIYIDGGDAMVTLNNVNVVGNSVSEDDGAGIMVLDSVLAINGGCVSDNVMINRTGMSIMNGAGIYADDSRLYLKGVKIENNQGNFKNDTGAAIHADDCTIYMDNCDINGNGLNNIEIEGNSKDILPKSVGLFSVIRSLDSSLFITNTRFTNNGYAGEVTSGSNEAFAGESTRPSSLFWMRDGELVMKNCTFTSNKSIYLFNFNDTSVTISDSDFRDGGSGAIYGSAERGQNIISNCKFSHGEAIEKSAFGYTFLFGSANSNFTFKKCDFGNSTFNGKQYATFDDVKLEGSIVGEGSLTMIVSIVALVVSVISICIVVVNKKKAVPAIANKAAETEDDE